MARCSTPPIPGLDYELAWPRELFRAEAAAVLRLQSIDWTGAAELLLEEAFTGSAPTHDLRTVTLEDVPSSLVDLWAAASLGSDAVLRGFLRHLAGAADVLPERAVPRPYWSARNGARPPGRVPAPQDTTVQLQRDWARLVADLQGRGYLDQVAPRECVDGDAPPAVDVLNAETERRLGAADLWPLSDGGWDTGTFYSLIEMVHDLLARPRQLFWHDVNGCGWHYSGFALTPARALYRWRVDRLLEVAGTGLRLAADGEDTGRLVHTAGDDRDTLVQRVLTTDTGTQDERVHAIATFRARTAGLPEKRSAIVTLAGLLEQRKDLLDDQLLSKDSGALFQIANQFDLRHRRANQRTDYEAAFLDWIFWWYLATLDLTDQLLARQDEKT